MKHYVPMLAAMVAFGAGCGQAEPGVSTAETTSAVESGSGTTATLSKEDRKFVGDAALGGMYEVALAAHVEKNASSPKVKEYAKKVAADHKKSGEELKQLAAKKGVPLPTQLDEDHREDLEDLTKLRGTELDEKYIDEMVDAHEEDVDEFRDAAEKGKDPDVRAWAGKTLRILEGHLVEAKQIKEQMGR